MNDKTVKIHYPWLSVLLVTVAATCFFLLANPAFLQFYQLPIVTVHSSLQFGFLSFVCLVVLWDIKRFNAQHKRYEKTLSELFKAKRQLQNKVHAYSSHSDKLKLFMSERLLEYIQYDEKFLHFKNIAAEVRHNGVICFDQVQSILNEVIAFNEQDERYVELATNSEEALASMRYLWDLLDLSTADNIALHIGNHLCESEEYYFQSLLTKESALPYQPTFKAHQVIVSCLMGSVESPQILKLSEQDSNAFLTYSDTLFYISINTDIEMLGNPNHLRLLAENLINNAQFYLTKKNMNKTQKPIAIELINNENTMELTVYNHGQHIKEEHKEKIFQLGYSTRRKKENHGKGLGLYFANSIAQGYEGNISFENVNNIEDVYSIRMVLEDGEIITEIVEITIENSQPLVVLPETDENKKNISWKFSRRISSVEVFSKKHEQTYVFTISEQDDTILTDPNNSAIPSWSVSISQKKRSAQLTLTPLDISGVKFQVSLPTAQARLDYSDEEADSINEDQYLEDYDNIIQLEKHYKD